MKKIAIVGPESTGKTELSKALAREFKVNWVPEFARTYLEKRNGLYTEKELVEIAKGQLKCQIDSINEQYDFVIFDTDLLVIMIWSEFKYGRIEPVIVEQWRQHKPDLYLLTYHDIPYEDDPLRENPNDREELFEIYKKELSESGVPYEIIKGNRKERLASAVDAIKEIS